MCGGFQENVVKTLGNRLENDTLETLTLAEQLDTNLTNLNVRIEGTNSSTLLTYNRLFVLSAFYYIFHNYEVVLLEKTM